MSKYKIWFQGATDRVHMAPYISKVEAHLRTILEPEFSATFHTTTPPVAIAPIASSSWPGTPSLRTRKMSSGVPSSRATS